MIFIGFISYPIKQQKKIQEIDRGFACWDLGKFSLDEFVTEIKKQIKPINGNVLNNYAISTARNGELFGITEEQYKKCTWGLLIPEILPDALGAYSEVMMLLNLYSPSFLYAGFYVTDFGVTRTLEKCAFPPRDQDKFFKKKKFVKFYRNLMDQSQYASWNWYRTKKWDAEDWRLFVSCLFFEGLKEFDNGKKVFIWQRESADMATMLEALFTATDGEQTEIGYRLRKRVAVLVGSFYPKVEDEIKALYSERSKFVHGSFFSEIAKKSKKNDHNLPVPDFSILETQKNLARSCLVAYLHLAKQLKSKPAHFGGASNVMDLLERAMLDLELRKKIKAEVSLVLRLLAVKS